MKNDLYNNFKACEHVSARPLVPLMRKETILPFLMHCIVQCMPAREAHEYLLKQGYCDVSLMTINRWRREAAKTLRLANRTRGRMSHAQTKKMHEEWHAKYGYPTLQNFIDGWIPGISLSNMKLVAQLKEIEVLKQQYQEAREAATDYVYSIEDEISKAERFLLETQELMSDDSNSDFVTTELVAMVELLKAKIKLHEKQKEEQEEFDGQLHDRMGALDEKATFLENEMKEEQTGCKPLH